MCNCHSEVGGATRAEDEGQEQTVASGPRRGWGWSGGFLLDPLLKWEMLLVAVVSVLYSGCGDKVV